MPPTYDIHTYLLSLPRLLGTTRDTVPAKVPYLVPDAELVTKWRRELEGLSGFKVGICWQGNPTQKQDRVRSFPLELFAPIAGVEGVRLISLQKGAGSEQISALGGR